MESPYEMVIYGSGSGGMGEEGTLMPKIEFPDEATACFPRDAIFNPVDNKFYVYCSRKLLKIDPVTGAVENSMYISNTDLYLEYKGAVNLNPEHKIAINTNPGSPYLYVATEDGKLVIVNYLTFADETSINPFQDSDITTKTSVIYDSQVDIGFWFVSEAYSGLNRIGKLSGNNEAININTDYGINDLAMNLSGDKLFISSSSDGNGDGIYEYSTVNLNLVTSFFESKTITALLYTGNDHLYADIPDDPMIEIIDFGGVSPSIYPYISEFIDNVNKLVFNPQNDKVYLTGYRNNSPNRWEIIDDNPDFDIISLGSHTGANGLAYCQTDNRIYCGGENNMKWIDGLSNAVTGPIELDLSISYDICINETHNIIMSVQPNSGNALTINSSFALDKTIALGGTIIQGCVKERYDKSYFAIRKTSEKSYVLVIDNATGLPEPIIELPSLEITGIHCNQLEDNDFVYAIGKYGNDWKVYEIDCSDNSFTLIYQIIAGTNTVVDIENLFVAPDNDIYISGNKSVGTEPTKGYFILLDIDDNYVAYPAETSSYCGCITDVIFAYNNLYVVSACSHDIFKVYFTGENLVISVMFHISLDAPVSVTWDYLDNYFYVGSFQKIFRFNHDFSSWDEIQLNGGDGTVDNILFNPYGNKIYGLTPVKLVILDDEDDKTELDFESENTDMLFNAVNNSLVLYSAGNSLKQLYVKVLDCETDDFIQTLTTNNYYNNKFDQERPVGDGGRICLSKEHNRIFVPHYSFSNISFYEFPTETLHLHPGWTWVSFPRLQRYEDGPVNAIATLERIDPFPDASNYDYLHMDYWDALEYQLMGINYNNIGGWSGDLFFVHSTQGYKLELFYQNPPTSIDIPLWGKVADPALTMELVEDVENWTGYFLPYSQMPEDAISEQAWEVLKEIKTQGWAMHKVCPGGGGCFWIMDYGKVNPFDYGDLVVLVPEDDFSFHWQNSGIQGEGRPSEETEYFTWEEKSDYVPFYIEFDSLSDVREVAVTAGGECLGASVREAGDTLVEVNGYLEGVSAGTALEFETWDGYKSSEIKGGNYLVYDSQTGKNEQRKIYRGEGHRYYLVSLKSSENTKSGELLSGAGCRPNPFTNSATITFRISEPMPVWIEILGQDGRIIYTLAGGEHTGGYYEYTWQGTDNTGQSMPGGIYFWRIRTGSGEQAVGKVVKMGNSRK